MIRQYKYFPLIYDDGLTFDTPFPLGLETCSYAWSHCLPDRDHNCFKTG